MDLIVDTPTTAIWGKKKLRCAIGKGGVITPEAKREGDGKTPLGTWRMREVYYRSDRVMKPITKLPVRELHPDDGWCENPSDANYNKKVRVPYRVPVDHLWRADHVYDLFVVLGYNDDPVVPGMGSAIFLHNARTDYDATAGCVAIKREHLLAILKEADQDSGVEIVVPLVEVIERKDAVLPPVVQDVDWDAVFASVPDPKK